MQRILLICTLLTVFLSACGTSATPDPTATPQESAWTACTLFIERQLEISYLDAQRYTASGVTLLEENRYRVEVYYPDHGDIFRCEILRRSDGNWELQSLDVK